MYQGLSDTNCQVANLHYRELVNEGLRQQRIAGTHPTSGATRLMSATVRRQVGAILVCAGQRLQGVQKVTSESLVRTPTGEMGAIA